MNLEDNEVLNYDHYKDVSVKVTIAKRRKLLKDVGISFEETVYRASNNIYWASLYNKVTGMYCMGKGISIEYCLASAYGEAIERIQNLMINGDIPINFLMGIPDINKRLAIPGEVSKKLTLEEDLEKDIIDHQNRFEENKLSHEEVLDLIKNSFKNRSGSDNFIYEPYQNITTGEERFLPRDIITYIDGSNGMSSGNSREEALVQGLSEILERYAEEYMYENNLTPPIISDEFLKDNFTDMYILKQQVEEVSQSKVTLYDCSLGKGIPVIGLMLTNPSQKLYRKQFGSHPDMNIAIERCLTELVQGDYYNTEELRYFAMLPIDEMHLWDDFFHYRERIVTHLGHISPVMFRSEASWDFKKWPSMKGKTNKELLDYLVNLVKRVLGKDIYVKDRSFLGIPTYQIYVPEISRFYGNPSDTFTMDPKFDVAKTILDKFTYTKKELTHEERLLLIETFEKKAFFIKRFVPGGTPLEVVVAGLYLEEGDVSRAANILNRVKHFARKWDVAYTALSMLSHGYDKNIILDILSNFYEHPLVDYVKNTWLERRVFPGIFSDRYSTADQREVVMFNKEENMDCTLEDVASFLQGKINDYY